MSHKHKNCLTFSLLLLKNSINGFFGMKPSSKNQALLQVYIHERTFAYQWKCWEMPFLSKNCGSISQELCGQGILSFGMSWWTFPSLKNTLNAFFSFPLVLHNLLSAILKSQSARRVFLFAFPMIPSAEPKSQSLSNPLERTRVRGSNCRPERKEID